MCVCIYLCMYVCIYVSMYVCMYVCMFVYLYLSRYPGQQNIMFVYLYLSRYPVECRSRMNLPACHCIRGCMGPMHGRRRYTRTSYCAAPRTRQSRAPTYIHTHIIKISRYIYTHTYKLTYPGWQDPQSPIQPQRQSGHVRQHLHIWIS